MRSYGENIYCLKMVTICFQFHGKNFEFMFGVVNGSFYRYTISTFLAQLLTDLLAFFQIVIL